MVVGSAEVAATGAASVETGLAREAGAAVGTYFAAETARVAVEPAVGLAAGSVVETWPAEPASGAEYLAEAVVGAAVVFSVE